MAKLVLPRVHVMVLCDLVEEHPDEEGVFNLLGARARLSAANFPYSPGQLCAYLQVTGHTGTVDLELAVVQASTDEEAVRIPPFAVQCFGPLVTVPLAVTIPDCWFPEAGIYYLQAYSGQKLLGERLVELIQTWENPNGGAS